MDRKFAAGDIIVSTEENEPAWFGKQRLTVIATGRSLMADNTIRYWVRVQSMDDKYRSSAPYFEDRFQLYENTIAQDSAYEEYQEIISMQEKLECPENSK